MDYGIGSAHGAFARARGALSSDLVSPSAERALAELVRRLPDLGGAQYVECRLGPDLGESVDLLISITKLQRDELSRRPASDALGGAGLHCFRRLLGQWASSASPLYEQIPSAWLEFDDVERQREPAANICVAVVPSYIDPFAPLTSQAPPELLRTMVRSLDLVRGNSSTTEEQRRLQRSIECLPSGGHWIMLSMMTFREPAAIKLYGVLPAGRLTQFLRDVEWQGDGALLQRVLGRYCHEGRTGGSIYLDLPLADVMSPSLSGIGICFSQQQVRVSDERDPTRRGLIADLVHDGLCTKAQAEALRAWPSRIELVLEGRAIRMERWSDIKLVLRPDGRLLAKAYLGFADRSPSASRTL